MKSKCKSDVHNYLIWFGALLVILIGTILIVCNVKADSIDTYPNIDTDIYIYKMPKWVNNIRNSGGDTVGNNPEREMFDSLFDYIERLEKRVAKLEHQLSWQYEDSILDNADSALGINPYVDSRNK